MTNCSNCETELKTQIEEYGDIHRVLCWDCFSAGKDKKSDEILSKIDALEDRLEDIQSEASTLEDEISTLEEEERDIKKEIRILRDPSSRKVKEVSIENLPLMAFARGVII